MMEGSVSQTECGLAISLSFVAWEPSVSHVFMRNLAFTGVEISHLDAMRLTFELFLFSINKQVGNRDWRARRGCVFFRRLGVSNDMFHDMFVY